MSAYGTELKAAEEACRAAGELLVRRRKVVSVREKADRTLVTDADLEAEAVILRLLRAGFPEDRILSEEAGEQAGSAPRRWIVDPLDGTTNYSRGLPLFAVSVALWDAGTPAAAAVHLPQLGEMFAATAGGPATLNGRPIRVSDTARVTDAMLNVYFDRHARLDEGLRILREAALSCEGRVKIMGSTASLLCWTACGRLDGFIRNTTNVWDFAAGALILERAAGALTDFSGQPLRRTGQSLLATNGRIHEELREIVCRAAAGPRDGTGNEQGHDDE